MGKVRRRLGATAGMGSLLQSLRDGSYHAPPRSSVSAPASAVGTQPGVVRGVGSGSAVESRGGDQAGGKLGSDRSEALVENERNGAGMERVHQQLEKRRDADLIFTQPMQEIPSPIPDLQHGSSSDSDSDSSSPTQTSSSEGSSDEAPSELGQDGLKRSTLAAIAQLQALHPADNISEQELRQKVPQLKKGAVPKSHVKYFAQRYRLFSNFDDGILLDEESWFSVTPERVAQHVAERCRSNVIIDAFCGVGGNAIAFAQTCLRVIAIDIDPLKIAMARHNARLCGVEQHITFVCADFFLWAKTDIARQLEAEVIFLSPPWGGPEYLNQTQYSLDMLQPQNGQTLYDIAKPLAPTLALFLPRNTVLQEIAALDPSRPVEVEEAWMSGKYKAMTCYFA